jgi:hypothetical protein
LVIYSLELLLELGLQSLEEETIAQSELEADQQRRLEAALRQAGAIGPNLSTSAQYLAELDNKNWRPIQATGKPASEIIIEQRRGLNGG